MPSEQVPHEPHKLLPFTGFKLCFSGDGQGAKQHLIKAVKQHGAGQSSDLDKSCSHLVIVTGGARTISAKERCVPIKPAFPAAAACTQALLEPDLALAAHATAA